MSSSGKQAIFTVNNLPRPQVTYLENGGNNGEKLKIVFHNLLLSGKEKKKIFGNECSFAFLAKSVLNVAVS